MFLLSFCLFFHRFCDHVVEAVLWMCYVLCVNNRQYSGDGQGNRHMIHLTLPLPPSEDKSYTTITYVM